MWPQVLKSTAAGAHWCQQLVPQHSQVAQGQVSGGWGEEEGSAQADAALEEAAAMLWGPAGKCDAGVCLYISPEYIASVCQHICQS